MFRVKFKAIIFIAISSFFVSQNIHAECDSSCATDYCDAYAKPVVASQEMSDAQAEVVHSKLKKIFDHAPFSITSLFLAGGSISAQEIDTILATINTITDDEKTKLKALILASNNKDDASGINLVNYLEELFCRPRS